MEAWQSALQLHSHNGVSHPKITRDPELHTATASDVFLDVTVFFVDF